METETIIVILIISGFFIFVGIVIHGAGEYQNTLEECCKQSGGEVDGDQCLVKDTGNFYTLYYPKIINKECVLVK